MHSVPRKLEISSVKNGVTFIIAISILFLVNPAEISSARVDTSDHHANLSVTPTMPKQQQQSDVTTQAALQHPLLLPSNNLVNTRATYDIGFRTTTAGVIKTIEMVFPAGTVASNSLVEFAGIGPGLLTRPTVDSLLYTVSTPVHVPANTVIRFEVGFFTNPASPTSTATAQITTRLPDGRILDQGFTNLYEIKQIGTTDIADSGVTSPDIADGAITSSKPAESFMKRVTLPDGRGWDPDGMTKSFNIVEHSIISSGETFFIIEVLTGGSNPLCNVVEVVRTLHISPFFILTCAEAPPEGSTLQYVVGNLPPHVDG